MSELGREDSNLRVASAITPDFIPVWAFRWPHRFSLCGTEVPHGSSLLILKPRKVLYDLRYSPVTTVWMVPLFDHWADLLESPPGRTEVCRVSIQVPSLLSAVALTGLLAHRLSLVRTRAAHRIGVWLPYAYGREVETSAHVRCLRDHLQESAEVILSAQVSIFGLPTGL